MAAITGAITAASVLWPIIRALIWKRTFPAFMKAAGGATIPKMMHATTRRAAMQIALRGLLKHSARRPGTGLGSAGMRAIWPGLLMGGMVESAVTRGRRPPAGPPPPQMPMAMPGALMTPQQQAMQRMLEQMAMMERMRGMG